MALIMYVKEEVILQMDPTITTFIGIDTYFRVKES